jgi:VWFA-related protein
VGAPDRISRRELLFGAAALCSGSRILRAWQNPTSTPTYTADVKVVNVLATVRDKKGAIVRKLERDDFALAEDGRPQVIRYFARETDLPLTLGLLVDTSMSQRRLIGQERTASAKFLDQVLREDKDKAFVIHFDHEVELLQDLTSSRQRLKAALDELEAPQLERRQEGGSGGGGGGSRSGGGHGGGTALYDAVLLASDELMKKQSGRKAVIVLSDGVDRGSKVTIESAIESAHRADTLVYSILFADEQPFGGFGGGPGWGGHHGGGGRMGRPGGNRPDGKKILQRLSKETGGGFFEVSKKQPIDQTYAQIDEELRSQYSLGFTSDRPDAGPGYRHITLTTKDKTLTVQAREGYYAG